MVQRVTSKRLAARAQFGSLLLAGMLSGSAAAQLPFPITISCEPSAVAADQPLAPPSLDFIPSPSALEGQPSKRVVHWLGLGRQPRKLPAATAKSSPKHELLLGALPELSAQPPAPIPSFKTHSGATRLVNHESPLAAPDNAVTPAVSTEPAEPTLLAQSAEPKSDGAIIGAPVPPLPLESLLDVDVPDLSLDNTQPTKAPVANDAADVPGSTRSMAAPGATVEMKLADESRRSLVQIHESFAPTKPDITTLAKKADSKPANVSAAERTTSGVFHLSDDEAANEAKPLPSAVAARKQTEAPPVKRAAPVKLPAPVAAALPEVPQSPAATSIPAELVASRTQTEPLSSNIASSSSQRPLSLRIGSSKMTPQSPTTRVYEHRSIASYDPTVNAQPVVRVVKPISPTDPTSGDADVKLCNAQMDPKEGPSAEAHPNKSLSHDERQHAVPTTSELSLSEATSSGSTGSHVPKSKLPPGHQLSSQKPANSNQASAGLSLDAFSNTEFHIAPNMVSELNRRIKQMFPGSRVEVKADDEGLVVDGVAASRAEAAKILSLVRKASLCPVADHVIEKR